MIIWLVAIVVAAALAGCAAQTGASHVASPSAEDAGSLRASLRPASKEPSRLPGGGGSDQVTGTLGADSVEGGCAYLEAADGTRYEVIYPDGWTVTASPLELRNPDDEVVASGGDTVTVRGSHAGDMASICQIGPIFRASEVLSIDR